MRLQQHWRLAASLFPALLLGTRVFGHFRKLGWSPIVAGVAQFLLAFVFGIAILWLLEKLLPTKRNVGSPPIADVGNVRFLEARADSEVDLLR